MDRLMARFRKAGAAGFGPDFPSWLKDAGLQLERDVKWDAKLTDFMASALQQAQAEFGRGGVAPMALERLNFLYTHGKAAQDLEAAWTTRCNGLTQAELQSPLFNDLERAFSAYRNGRRELVEKWLNQTEERFLRATARYEELVITPREVTTESVLGHRFLQEGADLWLEALALFRDGVEQDRVDESEVKEKALAGQRRLRFVSSLKNRPAYSFKRSR